MLSCSFFGHRDIEVTEHLQKVLKNMLKEKIVKDNYTVFYFGGFGDFDDLCYKLITELKKEFNDIKRIFCLTDYKYSTKPINKFTDKEYEEVVYFDLEFNWWYKRIYYRNLEIINRSDYVIFYVNKTKESGAYKAEYGGRGRTVLRRS